MYSTAVVVPPWIKAKRRRRRLIQWSAVILLVGALGYGGYAISNLTALVNRPKRQPAALGGTGTPGGSPVAGGAVTPTRRPATDTNSALRRPVVAAEPPVEAEKPVFRVEAPPSAHITVNGAVVPADWRTDTLPPGRYSVAGTIPGKTGCPPSHQLDSITLGEHGTSVARFAPLGCGQVQLDAQPSGASYDFRSFFSGDEITSGRSPANDPIMLPDGAYTLSVSARDCATYRDTVHVEGDSAELRHVRVRLVCGT